LISVLFHTLGCKLNQLETEALTEAFRDAGCAILGAGESSGESDNPGTSGNPRHPDRDAGKQPDMCVINTCTVTSKAEQKARRIIRFYLRKNCVILVTGCYAQLEQEELEALGSGSLFVVCGRVKDRLLDLPRYLAKENPDKAGLSSVLARWLEEEGFAKKKQFAGTNVHDNELQADSASFRFNPRNFSFHSRAFLKIQDGCDRNCAYCRVPLARGKSTSLAAAEVLLRLKALEEKGRPEAVITGVNIAQYRDPENPPMTLPALLHFLLDNTGRIALRLSSIEPEFDSDFGTGGIFTEEFFEVLSHPRIRSHFHISVQSGSDTILAAMGRPYRAHHIIEMAEKIRTIKDDPFLACDIITGFPGESDADFEKTLELCRIAGFAWIHAFPYSKRPGTPACLMKGQIRPCIAGKRLAALTEMARQGRKCYVRRWQGKIVEAIAEKSQTEAKTIGFPAFFSALTANYIRVRVPFDENGSGFSPGSSFCCKIGRAAEEGEKTFDAWADVVGG